MSELGALGRLLIVIGSVLVVVGILLYVFQRIPGLGRLPGDIHIRREGFTFFFPITTSIIISLLLSLFFYLFRR